MNPSDANHDTLPTDSANALLVGRVFDPEWNGPSVVAIRDDTVVDLSADVPTMADLLENEAVTEIARDAPGRRNWPLEQVLTATLERTTGVPRLLAPLDLQVIKACGVTFARSLLERVIEELAGGDPTKAPAMRQKVSGAIGREVASVRPGSAEAAALKRHLVREGLWSQYLEVGLGPDPEVFTKAPILSAVGWGAQIGIARTSSWNNPEPEVVLAVRSDGRIMGATLGNDVNLRDVEGRSALLLGSAKDNNASCAVGPYVRLFDENFDLDDLRAIDVRLEITGTDGFTLTDVSPMSEISRDPLELARCVVGEHHQYPDGFFLFTGTLFAPTQDRDEPGAGFTHRLHDVVRISCPPLGSLVNTVAYSEDAPPWTFGVCTLMRNLAERGML